MPSDLEQRLARIRLAAFDVDGVFTDGTFSVDSEGRDSVRFHTRDGLGVKLLLQAGIAVAWITGRNTDAVRIRAEHLGVRILRRGVEDKAAELRKIGEDEGVSPAEMLYMGDDLPDLPAMELAGVAATVADATAEVRERADLVSDSPGGYGAVREIAQQILSARGRVR